MFYTRFDLINRTSICSAIRRDFHDIMLMVLRSNLHVSDMLHLQKNLPPQVEYKCSVTLPDSCGRLFPVYLHLMNTAEAFLAVLKA